MSVLRMSAEQVQAYQAKAANWREWPNLHGEAETKPATPRKEYVPYKARRVRRGVMNRLETAFSKVLEANKASGEIDSWAFEAQKFKLADGAWYTPDFIVVTGGLQVAYEVKGFWREAARLRCKVFAGAFPHISLFAVKKTRKGEWEYEAFGQA